MQDICPSGERKCQMADGGSTGGGVLNFTGRLAPLPLLLTPSLVATRNTVAMKALCKYNIRW